MNDLLENAVAAYGGLNRWSAGQVDHCRRVCYWAIWQVKSKGDALKDVRFDARDDPERSLGGATGMLYATGYRDIDGIIIPTTRRGYAWQGDYEPVPEPLLVAIDMREITIC
jgi:hypothetical protein